LTFENKPLDKNEVVDLLWVGSEKTEEVISTFQTVDTLYFLGILGNVDTYFNVKTNTGTKVIVLKKISY